MVNKNESRSKASFFTPIKILASSVFIAEVVLAIIYKPAILSILPVFISVFILFMQTRVNRYAYLVGAINALLYAIAYYTMSLPATAAYALLVSFPLQLVTFFAWQKHTTKGSTATQKMEWRGRVILASAVAITWLLMYVIFKSFDSEFMFFDTTVSVLGIVATVLILLRYAEGTLIGFPSSIVSIIMYISMIGSDPSRIIWLIFTVYTLICQTVTFINMQRKAKH
jgi:nicotinamide mononucleotide transporter PnuC